MEKTIGCIILLLLIPTILKAQNNDYLSVANVLYDQIDQLNNVPSCNEGDIPAYITMLTYNILQERHAESINPLVEEDVNVISNEFTNCYRAGHRGPLSLPASEIGIVKREEVTIRKVIIEGHEIPMEAFLWSVLPERHKDTYYSSLSTDIQNEINELGNNNTELIEDINSDFSFVMENLSREGLPSESGFRGPIELPGGSGGPVGQ